MAETLTPADVHAHFEALALQHSLPRFGTDGAKLGDEAIAMLALAVSWKPSFAALFKNHLKIQPLLHFVQNQPHSCFLMEIDGRS
jgi:hypothetical protein